jgi:hypothetical protein
MSYTIACLNIHCVKTASEHDPVYRIFLDDQLIVERRFWPDAPDYFIQEQITLQDDDAEHSIWVKNVFGDRGRIRVHEVNFFDGDTRKPLDLGAENRSGRYTFKTVKR